MLICSGVTNNSNIVYHLFFIIAFSFFFAQKCKQSKLTFVRQSVFYSFIFFLFHISQYSSLHTCFVKVFFEVTKRYCAWLLRHLRRVVPFPHLKSVGLSLLKETEQNDHINQLNICYRNFLPNELYSTTDMYT